MKACCGRWRLNLRSWNRKGKSYEWKNDTGDDRLHGGDCSAVGHGGGSAWQVFKAEAEKEGRRKRPALPEGIRGKGNHCPGRD